MKFSPADFHRDEAPFRKALSSEVQRLEDLLSRQESTIRRAFLEFVRETTDESLVKEAADLIEQGDTNGALALIDSHVDRFGAVLPQLFQQGAKAELLALAPSVAAVAPNVGISFDPTNPRAADIMRNAKLGFIREFTNEQQLATRQALADSLQTGFEPAKVARVFRDTMGLTRYQLGVVDSYKTALEQGSRNAIDRALRDRRFDRSVERAVDTGEPIPPERIDKMVEAYRRRMLSYRSETIARTEARQVLSEAQQEAMDQTMARVNLSADDVEQKWNTTIDGRERMTHGALDGQVQKWGTPFQSISGAQLRYPGDPLAPAAEIISCRCHRTLRILPPGDRAIAA